MAQYQCMSTCLDSMLKPYAVAPGASCIFNCGYLKHGVNSSSVVEGLKESFSVSNDSNRTWRSPEFPPAGL